VTSVLRRIGLVLGPLAWIGALVFGPEALDGVPQARAAGLVAWMVVWWISEAVPIAWTACLPLVVCPLLPASERGHLDEALATVTNFVDVTLGLFAGGLALAAAMERWNLHRRLALFVLERVGATPPRLVLGVLVATAFVSLWISNTATAAMMLPIALALVREVEQHAGGTRREFFGSALLLAVAYGANLGGLGSKIGTAPNSMLTSYMEKDLGTPVSFLGFSLVGLPLVLLLVPCAWWLLWRLGRRDAPRAVPALDHVRAERRALGPWSRAERIVALVFASAAALWTASGPLAGVLRELGAWSGLRSVHIEATVALTAGLVLLLAHADGQRVLDRAAQRRIAWSTLLLLGGSLALAEAVRSSGLGLLLGRQCAELATLEPAPRLVLIALGTVAFSAVASNTATTALLLPILGSTLPAAQAGPALFTAALSSSCDFALPAGTPPNALVFGAGYLTVARMARVGIALDLVAALVVAAVCLVLVPLVL